jgi:DNA-binding response OmpR family regulator
VLLDIGLPHLNGYQVAEKLRATVWGKTMPLVAISGWGQSEDKRRAKMAGFDLHLTKPIDIEAVRTVLRNLQNASELRPGAGSHDGAAARIPS